MKTPESWEKSEIKKHLDSIGAWHFSPYMAGFGKAGVPDIIFCYRGRFGSVEVKREGKAPTPIQARRMTEIEQARGYTFAGTAEIVIAQMKQMQTMLDP